ARGRADIRDLPVFDDELDLGSVGDIAVLDRSSYDVFLLIGDDGDLLSVAVDEFAVDEAIAFTKVLEIGRGQVPERFRREHRGILRIAGSEFVEQQIEQDSHEDRKSTR